MSNPLAIKRISIKHDAIMDYLLCNPGMPLANVAMHFGITQGWLSQVIHSDLFQEELRKKQEYGFHHTVLPVKEKMLAVAHQALDQLIEVLPLERNAGNLSDIAGDVLGRLGYSDKAPSVSITNNNQQNNSVTVLQAEIEAARQLYGRGAPPPLEGQHEPIALPAASQVQGEGVAGLGAAEQRSPVSALLESVRSRQAGPAVRAEGAAIPAGAVP